MAIPTFVTGDVPTATQVNSWFVNVSFARKTSTESVTSSTTLQDDDQLTVAVDANTIYELSGMLVYDGATAGDIKLGWTGPSGSTLVWSASGPGSSGAGYTDDQVFAGASIASVPTMGALGTGVTAAINLRGLLVVSSTAGNLQLQWAQGTSSGTATRVFADSFLSLRRVG